jgi:hypothetical protein
MRLARDEFYDCSSCGEAFAVRRPGGCIWEDWDPDERWSDSSRHDSWLACPPHVCPRCDAVVWLADCTPAKNCRVDPSLQRARRSLLFLDDAPDGRRIVPASKEVTNDDVLREFLRLEPAVGENCADTHAERDRHRLGWIGRRLIQRLNSRFRTPLVPIDDIFEKVFSGRGSHPQTPRRVSREPLPHHDIAEIEKMRVRVLRLLTRVTDASRGDDEALLKCEWLRELGEWKAAAAMLQREFDGRNAADFAEQLEMLVAARVRQPVCLRYRGLHRKLSERGRQRLRHEAEEAAERSAAAEAARIEYECELGSASAERPPSRPA